MKFPYFWIKVNLSKIWSFCHFVTCEWLPGIFMKPQNGHNSPGLPLIMKISAFLFHQHSKLKKIKCSHFHDQRSASWVMTIFGFMKTPDIHHKSKNHKMNIYYFTFGWNINKRLYVSSRLIMDHHGSSWIIKNHNSIWWIS